jgi:hypothetical protein
VPIRRVFVGRRTWSTRPQLRVIRSSLRQLERAVLTLATKARHLERAALKSPKTRRRITTTPKRRAQLKLQGQYMGYMRQLKPRQKAQVRAAKAKGGYKAGIATARKLVGAGR